MYEYRSIIHRLAHGAEDIEAALEDELDALAQDDWELIQSLPGAFQLTTDKNGQWLVANTVILICRREYTTDSKEQVDRTARLPIETKP